MGILSRVKWSVLTWLDDLRFETLPWLRLRRVMPDHYANGGVRGAVRLALALFAHKCAHTYTTTGLRTRHCPCCGWSGKKFLPYVDAGYVTFGAVCPTCGAHMRHRGHRLFYERVLKLADQAGRLLYVAPERNVDYIRANSRLEVKTSNFGPSDADYDVDIMDIHMPDASWDFIICHRVIEHVPDDRKAMREFLRILKPGGSLIMSVPITFSRVQSIDYGKPNPYETMHYYSYGTDFQDRIPREFAVTIYKFSELFSPAEFKAMSLLEDWLFVCRKPVSV